MWPSCDSGAVFPTCMKAIKRVAPPPGPAGLARTPEDARERWRSDDFRYPPYQYKEPYILWSPRGWRLLEASEREFLHGYVFLHTSVCYSASDIKRSYSDYVLWLGTASTCIPSSSLHGLPVWHGYLPFRTSTCVHIWDWLRVSVLPLVIPLLLSGRCPMGVLLGTVCQCLDWESYCLRE